MVDSWLAQPDLFDVVSAAFTFYSCTNYNYRYGLLYVVYNLFQTSCVVGSNMKKIKQKVARHVRLLPVKKKGFKL